MKKKIQKKHVNRVLNDIVDFIEFDCYIKTLTILQLYKYGCSVIN